MSNPISEEQNTQQPGGAVDKVRKAARQLAYDVRYKVKGQFKDGQKSDAASLKSAYMQQLGKSPAPGPVKVMAKKMLVGEAYDLVDVSDTVNESVVNALLKVFTKTTQLEDADGNPSYEITDVVQEDMKEKKYKIRVTDKSTGKTYVRMADREKISQLRSDPRISSVEMTGYGDSYDKPVGKEKEEKKETAKEAFIHEVNVEDDNPDANTKKIDVMKGKNKIIINPTQSEQMKPGEDTSAEKTKESSSEKRIRMVKRKILQSKMQAVRQGAGADVVAHTEYEGEHISEGEGCAHTHSGKECPVHGMSECPSESKKVDEDPRGMKTKVDMVRNKLRAMGLKMSHVPEGESIDEVTYPKDFKKGSPVATKKKGRPNAQGEGSKKEIDERTRYAKETGKDFTTGKPSEKGGTRSGDSAYDKVRANIKKTGGLMSDRGKAIQPQGKKKEKGAKGYKGVTPVDKIKGVLAKKRAPKPEIGSRFD